MLTDAYQDAEEDLFDQAGSVIMVHFSPNPMVQTGTKVPVRLVAQTSGKNLQVMMKRLKLCGATGQGGR